MIQKKNRNIPIIKKNFYKEYAIFKKLNDVYEILKPTGDIVVSRSISEYFYSYCLFKKDKNCDLKSEYKKDMLEFHSMKNTVGIDMKLYHYSINKTAFHLFNKHKPINFKFEDLENKEEEWVFNSSRCGLRYCKIGIFENYKKLDINSFYARFLQSNLYYLPYGKPEKKKLTQMDLWANSKFNYGLYNVKIEIPDGIEKSPLFILNRNNIYTHLDLIVAKQLKYKLVLITDYYLYYKKK